MIVNFHTVNKDPETTHKTLCLNLSLGKLSLVQVGDPHIQ